MAIESDTVLNLYKRKSETPLQTIERYVALHPEFARVKMTYAGRLDPMAEGVLVILTGEKNKERETYTGLDKDYDFEFILGVETDTFDLLGKVVGARGVGQTSESAVRAALEKYRGAFEQKYPPYSSKVVNGTPLYDLARKGKLRDIDIPAHTVETTALELVSSREVARDIFVEELYRGISAVQGDFRQKEILETWDKYLATAKPAACTVYRARVSCKSGFYVRQLVSDLGRDLGTGAVTVSILRTRVGEYTLKDSIR